jgi:hypothetical protein
MTSQLPGSLKMIRGIQVSSIMPVAKIVLQALFESDGTAGMDD